MASTPDSDPIPGPAPRTGEALTGRLPGWLAKELAPGRLLLTFASALTGILAAATLAFGDTMNAILGAPRGDWAIYHDAALRWLSGASYFLPGQLNGPYTTEPGVVLYPPAALALFVPMALLPTAVWLLGPLAISGLALLKLRPARWTWPIMFTLVVWPVGPEWHYENPVVWTVALLFGWAAWGWPTSLIWLQPSMWPFVLIGIRSRVWWLGLSVVVALSLLLLPLSLSYVQVIRDLRGAPSITYGYIGWLACAMPLVAWLGSERCKKRGRPVWRRSSRPNLRWRNGVGE